MPHSLISTSADSGREEQYHKRTRTCVTRAPTNACYGLDVTKHRAEFAFDKQRSSLSSIQITPWSGRDKERRLLVTNGSHERGDGIGN